MQGRRRILVVDVLEIEEEEEEEDEPAIVLADDQQTKYLQRDIKLICPEDWKLNGLTCYRVYTQPRSWSQALSLCSRYGSQLARILTVEENDFVYHLARAQLKQSDHKEFWIGQFDQRPLQVNCRSEFNLPLKNRSSNFLWSNNEPTSKYGGFWHLGQPDLTVGSCVASSITKANDNDHSAWHLTACNHLYPFVCQLQACVEGMMFCHNGKCISKNGKCDGFDDCGDLSDEMNCRASQGNALCIRYAKGDSGIVESPNFPAEYKSNLNCQWTIEVAANAKIRLEFESFQTEPYYDIVTLLDGGPVENTSVVVDHISGNVDPSKLIFLSSTNRMAVKFRSDASVNFKGFKANWRLVTFDCGGRLKAHPNEQTINSPNYPQNYPNGAECLWIIEATGNQLISITVRVLEFINDVELENGKDMLIIYDGEHSTSRALFSTSSAIDEPRVVISTRNRVSVYFFSNYLNSARGFSISYRLGCDNTMQGTSGFITSPGNNAVDYHGDHLCTFTVNPTQQVMPPRPVTLVINHFTGNAETFLQIFDGMDNRGHQLYPPKGKEGSVLKSGGTLISETGHFFLLFKETPLDSTVNWNITYSLNCPPLTLSKDVLLSSTSTAYGTKVNISCPYGSEFINGIGSSTELTCLLGGQWSQNFIPRCQPIYCPIMPVPAENGFVAAATNVTYMGKVSIKCYRGHAFSSGLDVEEIDCNEDGTWSKIPQCKALVCPELPEFVNGNRTILRGDGRSYGTIYKYRCFSGSYMEGTDTVLCEMDGWSSPEPVCKKLSCEPISYTGNVLLKTDALKIYSGDVTPVECRPGYKMVGKGEIICQDNQQFTELPVCEDIDECRLDGMFDCSSLTTTCKNLRGGYACECLEGYEPKLECNSTSELIKSMAIPSDSIISESETWKYPAKNIATSGWCGKLPEPGANSISIVLDEPRIIEAVIIKKISDNTLAQVMAISLKYSLHSTHPLKQYVDNDGSKILLKSNGGIIMLPEPIEAEAVKITIEEYKSAPCMIMELQGCRRTSCTDINECLIDKGGCEHLCINRPGKYECSCHPGYELFTKNGQNDMYVHPKESGTRLGDVFGLNKSCIPRTCNSLIPPENGDIVSTATKFSYPIVVEFVCNFGFQLHGSQFLQCMSDGHWNASVPVCSPAKCANFENDTEIGLHLYPGSQLINFGENVTITCAQDTRPNSPTAFSHFRQCLFSPDSDGPDYRLAGLPPTCELVDCGEPEFLPASIYKNFDEVQSFKFGSNFLFTCRKPFFVSGSSNAGDHIVRCLADGSWDFGDLHCDGTVCPDPGILQDGDVIIDSVEEGNIARFTCRKPGYMPYPISAMQCIIGAKCPKTEELGISSGVVPDTAFAANTETPIRGYEPHKARMSRGGWCGSPDAFMFLSVDLQHVYTITTLRLAGVGGSGAIRGHVTKFQLFYKSLFNQNFDTYPEEFEMPPGNHNKMYVFQLKEFIRARYILIGILEFDNNPCLRFDLLGCSMPLFQNPEIHSEFMFGWNDSLPICRDSEPPTFTDCPMEPLYAPIDANGQMQPIEIPVPNAIDNSGSIAWIKTEPPEMQNFHVLTKDTNVTYTAFDAAGNWAQCSIELKVPDNRPPVLVCPESYIVEVPKDVPGMQMIFNRSSVDLMIDDASDTVKLTFSPGEIYLKLKQHVTVKVTAEDDFGNEASCRFQVLLDTPRCDESNLLLPPGVEKTCSSYKSGIKCTISCIDGYQFLESDASKKLYSCEADEKWTPGIIAPACVPIADEPAKYQLKVSVSYPIATTIPESCLNDYKSSLTSVSQQIDTVLSQRCSASVQAFVRIVEVDFFAEVKRVVGNYTIQVLPTVLDEVFYNLCGMTLATMFDLHFPSATEAVLPLLEIKGENGCPVLKATNTTIDKGFSCSPGEILQKTENALPGCYPCPMGTWLYNGTCRPCENGTYQDLNGQINCKRCPAGTYTLHEGATMVEHCQPVCDNGMFSESGIVPCQQCPKDTYSSPNKEGGYRKCESCPKNTFTNDVGASDISMCKESCPGGYFSFSGLQPCSPCPKNFYQPERGQSACIECPKDRYTENSGAVLENECLEANYTDLVYCRNGAVSEVVEHVAVCQCLPGYTGIHCEQLIDPCLAQPCFNNGRCVTNGVRYECECPEKYSGERCEFSENECQDVVCDNGGICQDLPGIGTTKCLCRTGFYGERCEFMVNLCEKQGSELCLNGATCLPLQLNRYMCICAAGWTGRNCDINIDDCAGQPCAVNATCHDEINDFRCDCPPGFSGKRCHIKQDLCSDNPCVNGRCIDRNFYYQCVCESGWTGKNCEQEIDNCASNPCLNGATCTKQFNSYECECADGYEGSRCQHQVDHCAKEPCLNGALCVNKGANYSCICKNGFEGMLCERAVKECSMDHHCGIGSEQCIELTNGFACKCRPGFTGRLCDVIFEVEIDECEDNPCLNGGTCTDDVSSFKCACPAGWTGSRCEVSANYCDRQPCQNNGQCVNLGKDYFCLCPKGFDGKSCEIDSATCFTDACLNGGECIDNGHEIACKCPPGFFGSGCQYQQKLCSENTCQNGGTCAGSEVSIVCICPAGFTGLYCENDIDDCATSPCPPGSTCIDMPNGHICQCMFNKTGINCDKAVDSDFELRFYDPILPSFASLDLPFPFSSEVMTLALWVRFDHPGQTATFLTIYSGGLFNKEETAEELLVVSSSGVEMKFPNEHSKSVLLNFPQQHRVDDGNWNNVVFQWDSTMGIYTLYWNSIRVATIKDQSKTKHLNTRYGAWVKLGTPNGHKRGESKFVGSISRLNIWNRTLSFEKEIPRLAQNCRSSDDMLANLVLRWTGFNRLSGKVDRVAPSTCGQALCQRSIDVKLCDPSKMLDKNAPKVHGCPEYINKQSEERSSKVEWPEPSFTDELSLERIERNIKPGTVLGQGLYHVIYAAYDKAGNVAQCMFDLRVQESFCPTLADPKNGLSYCLNWGPDMKFEACTVRCQEGYEFSEVTPEFYTCGYDGFWRPRYSIGEFRYPDCSPTSPSVRIVSVQLDYPSSSVACSKANRATLESSIRKRFITMNAVWNLCEARNSNEIGCPSLNVTVSCMGRASASTFQKRQVKASDVYRVDLSFVANRDPVRHRHSDIRANIIDTLKDDIVKENGFDFSSVLPSGTPDLRSLKISDDFHCPIGQVNRNDVCARFYFSVPCAMGSFFNITTLKCQLCPIGMYQNQVGQLACEACPAGHTTTGFASSQRTDCKESCPAGHFYNLKKENCEPCGYGFYQPSAGSFQCIHCDLGKSTYDTVSTSKQQCSDICPDGMQLSAGGDCQPCPMATYRRRNENDHCESCPAGLTTEDEGSISIEQCNLPLCLEGQYLDESTKKCFPCEKGFYQDQKMQRQCLACPKDHTTADIGASQKSECYSTNQCETLEHNCHWHAVCLDLPGEAFECQCQPGYRGNGTFCEDSCINFCTNDAVCKKSDNGDPFCQCKDTFTGTHCEVRYMPSQQRIAYIAGGVGGVVGVIVLIMIVIWMIYFRFRSRDKLAESMEKLPNGNGAASSDEKSIAEMAGNTAAPNFTYGRTYSEDSHAPTFYYEDDDDYGVKTMYIGEGFDENDNGSRIGNDVETNNEAVFERLQRINKHVYKPKYQESISDTESMRKVDTGIDL
ncbi:Fibropellin-1 [Trichinella nelsoni]|uniref:Fibropellin-1 n=1 Tax=Trichinella nelsoni TaxID=6336 RepID=A0A0V0RMW0_9BILA|nr:Fibropellin-1 [Trichinella nelsoni]